jgi:hypothetical protein
MGETHRVDLNVEIEVFLAIPKGNAMTESC